MDERPEVETVLPPTEPFTVYRIGAAGVALTALAAVINPLSEHLDTLRLLLVAAGCVTAGSAITMRPMLSLAWLIAAAAFALAWPGLPAHWDSARIVASVGAAVAISGAAITALPRIVRHSVLSALAMVHFGGIFCATTWPDPAPWTTQMLGQNVYLPYLMFMYLRNAYHFYSPNPGPASHLFILVKYDRIDPKTGKPEARWITLPNRDEHMKDPLGLTYFRRLSITEQSSQTVPPPQWTFEGNDISARRRKAGGELGGIPDYPRIPLAPEEFEPQSQQYRMPRPDISRYLLPSYANHILRAETTAERKPVSVKIYRLEHRVMPTYYFVKGRRMSHPTTYRPYYLGEFAANSATGKVELQDPQDPLLYWLVPIVPKPDLYDPKKIDFIDFMSEHAKYRFDWSSRQP